MSEAADDEEIFPPVGVRVGFGPHGRGVFAVRAIASDETIEICPTIEVAEADVGGALGDYVINSGSDPSFNVMILGYGSLYNHSYEPCAEYQQHTDDSLAFVALRDIAEGEEITIDYGEEWWETRDLEPGS